MTDDARVVLIPEEPTPEIAQAMADCYDPTWGYADKSVSLDWARESYKAARRLLLGSASNERSPDQRGSAPVLNRDNDGHRTGGTSTSQRSMDGVGPTPYDREERAALARIREIADFPPDGSTDHAEALGRLEAIFQIADARAVPTDAGGTPRVDSIALRLEGRTGLFCDDDSLAQYNDLLRLARDLERDVQRLREHIKTFVDGQGVRSFKAQVDYLAGERKRLERELIEARGGFMDMKPVVSRPTGDYMDTPHYRVNRFSATVRVLGLPNARGIIYAVDDVKLTIDDLEAVVQASAPLFMESSPVPRIREWHRGAPDSIVIRFAGDITNEQIEAFPRALVATLASPPKMGVPLRPHDTVIEFPCDITLYVEALEEALFRVEAIALAGIATHGTRDENGLSGQSKRMWDEVIGWGKTNRRREEIFNRNTTLPGSAPKAGDPK